jgi:hypothetical protein
MNPLMLQLLALILGFVLWAGLVYLKFTPAEPLIALLQMGLGGLITHMLKGVGAASVAKEEGGFASVRMLVIVASIALGLSMLGGCASLTEAGHNSYSVIAKTDKDGNVTGYDLSLSDGKEFESRTINFQSAGPMVRLSIEEGASKAFKGQALAVKGLTILPSMGLQDILAPRDK